MAAWDDVVKPDPSVSILRIELHSRVSLWPLLARSPESYIMSV